MSTKKPRYDLWIIWGGYLGDHRVMIQEVSGQEPELEDGQHAHRVVSDEDSLLTADIIIEMFDSAAEGDNYHEQIGVMRTIADIIEDYAGERHAITVLYHLARRYSGVHEMGC